MAVNGVPIFIQAGGENADDARRALESMLGLAVRNDGVASPTDLATTEKSGTPDMSVDVAAGEAFVAGDEATDQGYYHVSNDAVVNVTISAADGSNPRKDLIVFQVRDSQYSGANDDAVIQVVTGTAAATPSEPATPDNAIVLALVDVAAGVSSITDSDITDRRSEIAAWRPENYYAARLSATAAQSIPDDTITQLTFGTENWDPSSSAGSNAFTVPVDGRYRVTAFARASGTMAASTRIVMLIYVDGGEVGATSTFVETVGVARIALSVSDLDLVAAEAVTAQLFHNAGVAEDWTTRFLAVSYQGPSLG